jgi:uncharacterized protein (TIGR00297 family)
LYRLINFAFIFLTVYLFILEGSAGDHIRILLALMLALCASLLFFIAKWVTLDAMKAVIVFGVIILGFGGWTLATAAIFFFVSSTILGILNIKYQQDTLGNNEAESHSFRRDGYQVWANGFWIAVFSMLWFLNGSFVFFMAALGALAVATADTWATEIGTKNPGKTVNILTLKSVEPGEDGGISFKGTAGALAGALILSSFVFLTPFYAPFPAFLIVLISGIAGMLFDSVAGALSLKYDYTFRQPSDFTGDRFLYNNHIVNWIGTGIGGLIALLTSIIAFG